MLRTFCYQSFEVAPSWSGTPSILSFSSGFFLCCWISFYIRFLSLGRKKGRNGIGMLISGAENWNRNGSGFGVCHVIPVFAPKCPNRGFMKEGGKRALNVHWKHVLLPDARFATVWALKLKVSDEFIAGGLHKEQSTCLGSCFLSRRPLAERILGWICHKLDILRFYRLFSGSELLPYGTK